MPRVEPGEFVVRFSIIIAVTIAMLFVDTAIAGVDRRESRLHARHLYEDADLLVKKGKYSDAVDNLRRAVALDRGDSRYAIALASALLASNRPERAREVIDAVLDAHGTSGPANLAMARILLTQRDTADAIVYFHRAIYGLWASSDPGSRREARLELIAVLSGLDLREQLLAELLPLEADSAPGLSRPQLAHLYVVAGSYGRAASIYRDLLREDSTAAEAYAGLGEIALLTGNLQTAHADLSQALRLSADSRQVAEMLAKADSAIERESSTRQ
jgi:tetratricopeptide (TPR) repeat protein